jgi:hypothetical protein
MSSPTATRTKRRLTLSSIVLDNMAPTVCYYHDAADRAIDHHIGFATQGAHECVHLHVSDQGTQHSRGAQR